MQMQICWCCMPSCTVGSLRSSPALGTVPVHPPRPGLPFGDTVAQFPPAVRVLAAKTPPSWRSRGSLLAWQAGPVGADLQVARAGCRSRWEMAYFAFFFFIFLFPLPATLQ